MVTKYEIQEWVQKCKNKALKSVVDEHTKELHKLVVGNKELLSLYKVGLAHEEAKKSYEEMFKANGCIDVKMHVSFSSYGYGPLYSASGGPLHSIGYIISKNEAKYAKEHALVAAATQKYNDVAKEYGALCSKCTSIKPKAAVEYLERIGFDVTTLVNVNLAVDTSKLFVCNDNKPG